MADETYRKFHAGRFGPVGTIDPDFATKVESGGSFQNSEGKKKKEEPEKKEETGGGSGPEPGSDAAIEGYSGGGY